MVLSNQHAQVLCEGNQWGEKPVIWKVSDAVAPGGAVGIYGHGLDAQQIEVKMCPHTGLEMAQQPGADAIALPILQYDIQNSSYVMARFPEDAKAGLYDLWVKNSAGWSNGLTLNAPRPLFISEYEAWAGQSISLSGRGLDGQQFGATRDTMLRLVGTDGTRYPQTITKLTPYSLAFTLGQLPLGSYEVQLSNNGGASWFGLQSKQRLTVLPEGNDFFNLGVAWMDCYQWANVFRVTDYGAGWKDPAADKAAFEKAAAAAKAAGGGVVYMPNGTYYLDRLQLPSGVVLMGEEMEKTVLVYCGNGAKENFIQGDAQTQNEGYLGFARFTVRLEAENKRPECFFWLGHDWADGYPDDVRIRSAKNFFLYQVCLDSAESAPAEGGRGLGIVLIAKERFLVQDCKFHGFKVAMGSARINEYETLRNNHWDLSGGNLYISGNYSFVEGNKITGRYTLLEENEYQGGTHGFCVSAWCHVEGNFVGNMGARDTGPTGQDLTNDGETYLVETQDPTEFGAVVDADRKTVTVCPQKGKYQKSRMDSGLYNRNWPAIAIIRGRGMGQLRKVENVDCVNRIITVKDAWDVIPDSTSFFTLVIPMECTTFYNNVEQTSAKGVYLYGSVYDVVVAGHQSQDCLGISVCVPQVGDVPSRRFWIADYIDIRDNVIKGYSKRAQCAHIGVISERGIVGSKFYATSAFGIEIRNNRIEGEKGLRPTGRVEGPPASGIVLRSGTARLNSDNRVGDISAVMIENNALINQDLGIRYTLSDYGILIKDNAFYACDGIHRQDRSCQVDPDAKTVNVTHINSRVYEGKPME